MMPDTYFDQIALRAKQLLGPTIVLSKFLDLLVEDVSPDISVRSANVISKNFPDIRSFVVFNKDRFSRLRNVGVSSERELVRLQICFIDFINAIKEGAADEIAQDINPLDVDEPGYLPLNLLFPKLTTLPENSITLQVLNRRNLPRRALNLISNQFPHIGPLIKKSELELLSLKNVGSGTIKSIIEELNNAEENFSSLTDSNLDGPEVDSDQLTINHKELNIIRLYFETFGHEYLNRFVESTSEHIFPDNIKLACTNLIELIFPKPGQEASPVIDLDLEIDRILDATLDFRAQQVIKMRFLDNPTLTLEQVGNKLNVTRERIRQIENKSVQTVAHAINSGEFPVLSWILPAIEENYGLCFSYSEFETYVSTLPTVICSNYHRLWSAMRLIDSEKYLIKDDWAASRDSATISHINAKTPDVFGTNLVQSRTTILENLRRFRWSPQIESRYLSTLKELPGDYVCPKGINAEELVFHLLAIHDRPLKFDSIMEMLGHSYSKNGLRERLRLDHRFSKLIDHQIGLAKWGHEEIGMIKDEIDLYINAQPNSIARVSDLIDDLESRGFKSSSIITYLTAPKYELFSDKVRLRKTFQSFPSSPDYSKAKRFYPLGNSSYSLRIKVTSELIRGIGPNISPMVFGTLRGKIGELKTYHCSGHEIRVTWNPSIPQPSFSTLRSICASLHASVEDEILLIFNTIEDSFNFTKVSDTLPLENRIEAIYSTTGINLPEEVSALTAKLITLFICSDQHELESILSKREDQLLLESLMPKDLPDTDFEISDLL